jgi:NAD+ synthase (glutamine-hydrolysing)
MTIALAQINTIVGDLAGNAAKIVRYAERAVERGADLVVFPELCVTGYPPLDLLDSPSFLDATERALEHLAGRLPSGTGVIVGAPVRNESTVGKRLFNAAILLEDGREVARAYKTLLPTYDVFDEVRYFEPAPERKVTEWRGVRLGLHVCEDMWNNEADAPYHLYAANPIDELAAQGIDLFVNISASPFAIAKQAQRDRLAAESCREHGVPLVLVNQVGAQTELVFDGNSRVYGADGSVARSLPAFEESLALWTFEPQQSTPPEAGQSASVDTSLRALTLEAEGSAPSQGDLADLHAALVLGIRDYFEKTGAFSKALVGLSGGIDSAVTCALAAEALGADRVVGITMPSRYSSEGSVTDSEVLAQNLGIEFHEVAIAPAVDAFEQMLAPLFEGTEAGIAEENVQARSRGLTLMAVSNKFGHLLLTTGNKSEMSVGYATLYGDMSGGLAVLSDVFKMEVYALARRINREAEAAGRTPPIPESTITKPPSAELRPDQRDEDSLPPYPVLDEILRRYIELHEGPEQIVAATGFDADLVRHITRLVDRNEYKRRQAAPGIRVTAKAFGMGRRVPIVMRRTSV